jgi:hypothetical protein
MTDNLTSDTGTQVSSIDMILRCDAGTHVDSNLTSEASTQTNDNEQPENRTDGSGAEKDRHIQKLNATIQQMKER